MRRIEHNKLTTLNVIARAQLAGKMDNFMQVVKNLLLIMFLGVWSAATVAAEAGNSLVGLGFSSLPGNQVQITLTMSGEATQPLSFTTENPARIAFDFPGVTNKLKEKRVDMGVGVARSITAVESGGRTRVVVNLARLVDYETSVDGKNVSIRLQGSSTGTVAVSGTATAADGAPALSDLDFRRGPAGEGRVTLLLTDPGMPVDMIERGDKVIIDLGSAELPASLHKSLDVTDFATPVTKIDSQVVSGRTQVAINFTGNVDRLAYQAGNQYTVEIKPVTKETQEEMKKKKFGYTGERLSLNFQNIEVRAVLQLLADFTDLNIVTSDTVSGNVTLRLKNVPWDQALELILKSKGLSQRREGNVIRIAPTEEIAALEKQEFESQKQIEELAPLRTEVFRLNFANATDLQQVIVSSGGDGDEGIGLLSERGSAVVDPRTNTLMIKDTDRKLEEFRRLLELLDVPVRQVLIESRIVIANSDFNKELGARFGVTRQVGREDSVMIGGSTANNFATQLAATDPRQPTLTQVVDNSGLNVNLPVIGAFGSIAASVIGDSFIVDLELSALHAEGRGEILSNPRVITANGKEAFIEQGVEIPYQEASSSGAATVSFKKAVLALTVTPQITPDEHVILELNVKKDSVGEVFAGIPSIDTREVETQVLVDNGETVVLGGVYEQTSTVQTDKVPFFGDLPGIGRLFRQDREEDDREELLIFVTPKIVEDGISLNQ